MEWAHSRGRDAYLLVGVEGLVRAIVGRKGEMERGKEEEGEKTMHSRKREQDGGDGKKRKKSNPET